jgi:hypothetical protein
VKRFNNEVLAIKQRLNKTGGFECVHAPSCMLTNKYPQLEEMQSYITAAIQNVTESR